MLNLLATILLLSFLLYFWKLSIKYALLGFILGCATFSLTIFIVRIGVTAHILPESINTLPRLDTQSVSYAPILILGLLYAVLAAAVGNIIELIICLFNSQKKRSTQK